MKIRPRQTERVGRLFNTPSPGLLTPPGAESPVRGCPPGVFSSAFRSPRRRLLKRTSGQNSPTACYQQGRPTAYSRAEALQGPARLIKSAAPRLASTRSRNPHCPIGIPGAHYMALDLSITTGHRQRGIPPKSCMTPMGSRALVFLPQASLYLGCPAPGRRPGLLDRPRLPNRNTHNRYDIVDAPWRDRKPFVGRRPASQWTMPQR